jgi:hypothetical protein
MAVGAGVMYFLDPESGFHRRQVVRQKLEQRRSMSSANSVVVPTAASPVADALLATAV